MSHTPESEILPTDAPTQAPPIAEPSGRRFYSEWDPRSAPGTYFLLAINIAVFVWMLLHGVPLTGGTPDQLMAYGANNSVAVLADGQWWRLFTPIFVHIGILHIGGNMWCLWNLGLLGEPLIGPFGLVAVYVLTGVAGNLLTVAWDVGSAHFQGVSLDAVAGVGAGASGAVFGIAGILIILLSNSKLPIPWSELKRLRRSVVQFSIINLALGASTSLAVVGNFVHVRVDNTAHLGGFLSGLALGPGLTASMTAGRVRYLARQRIVFLAAAFILALLGYGIANFNH